ncbi:unnamed protein product [Gordionus sp. m RMFG-2023]
MEYQLAGMNSDYMTPISQFPKMLTESLKIVNTSADACTDIYKYACGNYGPYLRDKTIKYASEIKDLWHPIRQMELEMRHEIGSILEGAILEDLTSQHQYLLRQVHSFYKSCMNEEIDSPVFTDLINEYFNDSAILSENATIFTSNLLDLDEKLQWDLGLELIYRIYIIRPATEQPYIYIHIPFKLIIKGDIYREHKKESYNAYSTYIQKTLEKLNMDVNLAQDIMNFEESLLQKFINNPQRCKVQNDLVCVNMTIANESVQFINLEKLLRKRSDAPIQNAKVCYCEEFIKALNEWFKKNLPYNNRIFYYYLKVFVATKLMQFTSRADDMVQYYSEIREPFTISRTDYCQDEATKIFNHILTATYIHKTGFKRGDMEVRL